MSLNQALDFRWLGPYKIAKTYTDKGYYRLKELGNDSPWLRQTFAGNKLKLFYKRSNFIYNDNNKVREASREDDNLASLYLELDINLQRLNDPKLLEDLTILIT